MTCILRLGPDLALVTLAEPRRSDRLRLFDLQFGDSFDEALSALDRHEN